MPTRADVLDQLSATMADIEAFYRDLSEDGRRQPINESAVEGELEAISRHDHISATTIVLSSGTTGVSFCRSRAAWNHAEVEHGG